MKEVKTYKIYQELVGDKHRLQLYEYDETQPNGMKKIISIISEQQIDIIAWLRDKKINELLNG